MDNRKIQPRTIRSFLFELNSELVWCRNDPDTLAVVFHTVLIKHLFYDKYRELEYGRRMPDAFMFQVQEGEKEKNISILQLVQDLKSEIRTAEEIKEILYKNPVAVFCISHYNYGWKAVFNAPEKVGGESAREHHDRIMISEDLLAEQEKNDRIDHIIWYLISRGTSEYTNPQVAVERVKPILLIDDLEEQKEAWNVYCSAAFYGTNAYKNSETIFKLGVKPSVSLFQAFYVTNQGKETWLNLLGFYSEVLCPAKIDMEVIDTMTYVDLYKGKDVLIKSAALFSGLRIEGNLNQSQIYWRFLSKYISAIRSYGYGETYFGLEMREGVLLEAQKNIVSIEKVLDYCKGELQTVREQYAPEMLFAQELQILQKFIDHNIELIKTPTSIYYQFPINVNISSKPVHQDENVLRNLMELKQTRGEGLGKAADQAYREGKLSVWDFKHVMESAVTRQDETE